MIKLRIVHAQIAIFLTPVAPLALADFASISLPVEFSKNCRFSLVVLSRFQAATAGDDDDDSREEEREEIEVEEQTCALM